MEDNTNNQELSDDLFHEIMKCTHLIRSSLHHLHRSNEFCSKNSELKEGLNAQQNSRRFGHHGRHCGDEQRIGQIRLLSIILEKDSVNQKELAEALMITPASVSELLTKLEADNYIERKQNEDDKRVTNIILTDSGRDFAKRMKEIRLESVKTIFSTLEADEQEQLLALIQKINTNLASNIKGDECHEHLHRHMHGLHHNHCHNHGNGNHCGERGMHGRRGL